jgi:hypothetical protein
MITDWSHQEFQLGLLTTQAERYLATFRWLWLLNLAVAIIGAATRHYGFSVVAAVSSVLALIGTALARLGRTTVSEMIVECRRIRYELEPR